MNRTNQSGALGRAETWVCLIAPRAGATLRAHVRVARTRGMELDKVQTHVSARPSAPDCKKRINTT